MVGELVAISVDVPRTSGFDGRVAEITVLKCEGRLHRCVVTGTAVGTRFVPMYDYGAALPHDLVHYVVERDHGLRWGFWGLVVAGAEFEALNRATARRPRSIPRADDPLIAAHLEELMEAESLAASVPADHAGVTELNARWQALGVDGRLQLAWDQ